MINLVSFIPEILILTLIIVSLLTGLFYKASKNILTGINFLGFIFIAYLFISFGDSFQNVYSEIKDFNVIILSKIIISLFTALYILLINKSLSNDSIYRYEFLLFVLFATLGSFILISSNNFLTAFIGIELQSLSLYLMAAFNTKNLESNEAGIKYFSLGALSSGFLLFGISMVYFDNSSIQFSEIEHVSHFTEIGLALILIALFFKVSAAPFHIWTPDVYQGSPTISVLFFATLPKFASLIFLFRFFLEMDISSYPSLLFIFKTVCILSLLIGAYGAITQTVIKRLLAFSSINHIGFILLSILSFKFLSQGIFFFYLLIYLVTNFGVFSVLLTLRNSSGELKLISDLSGLKTHNKSKAIALLVLFFSLAGIPPLAGFFAKLYVFMSVIESGMYTLAIVGLLSTVISAFYYLRIIKIIYFDEIINPFDKIKSLGIGTTVLLSCSILVLFFLYPSILNNIVNILSIK